MHIHEHTELAVVCMLAASVLSHFPWHCSKEIIDIPLLSFTFLDCILFCTCAVHMFVGARALLCMWRSVGNFRVWVSSTMWVSEIELRLSGRADSSWAIPPDPRPLLWRKSSEFPFQVGYVHTYNKETPSLRMDLEAPRGHARTGRNIPKQSQARNTRMPVGETGH